jgi:hypothetical protein
MTTNTWAALVGFVLPALVAIINRSEWKSWVKGIVALLASVVVGTITALLAGSFTGASWLQAISIVFAASQVAYHTWWKNSDIAGLIEQFFNIFPKPVAPPLGGIPGQSNGKHFG